MDPKKRIVTNWPLTELWDETGPLDYVRGQSLAENAIRDRLRSGAVQFVVANSGHPLEWIAMIDCFNFWKSVVRSRIVPPGSARIENIANAQAPPADLTFRLEDYPDEYAFMASEWLSAGGESVILLEKHH